MPSNFPTSLDVLIKPNEESLLDGDGTAESSHSSIHIKLAEAIEALQDSVGIIGSTNPSSIRYLLGSASAAPAWVSITGKPNTLSGYGITDASPSSHTHSVLVNGTKTATFDSLGNFTVPGDVSGLSDQSLKENVETIKDALEKVKQLRGVLFNRNDLPGYPRQAGFIAQEVNGVLPEVTHTAENGLMSVSYGNLNSLLVEAIKELSDKVDKLIEQTK